MAAGAPDPSATLFDALPKAARKLLIDSAEHAMTTANGALGRLLTADLAPAAAAEWHGKVLTESIRKLFEAWETIEPSDRYLAALWAFMVIMDQHLRQGEWGINLQRQHNQLPDLSALTGHGSAEPGAPAPGSSA